MSRILVWCSDADGRLFRDKTEYQKHIRRLARNRREARKREQERQAIDAKWTEFYEREMDISEWPQFVIDNQDMFWDELYRPGSDYGPGGFRYQKGLPRPRLLEFTAFNLHWSDRVSNSHHRPHNGVENWCAQNKNKPTGYPGWEGRIEWIVAWPQKFDGHYPGSDIFSRGSFSTGRQRAHTGTGGGGHMSYSRKYKCHVQTFGYDFRLYADDWPGMARYHARRRTWEIVSEREYA